MRPYFAKVFIGTGFEPVLNWFQATALTTQLQLPYIYIYIHAVVCSIMMCQCDKLCLYVYIYFKKKPSTCITVSRYCFSAYMECIIQFSSVEDKSTSIYIYTPESILCCLDTRTKKILKTRYFVAQKKFVGLGDKKNVCPNSVWVWWH